MEKIKIFLNINKNKISKKIYELIKSFLALIGGVYTFFTIIDIVFTSELTITCFKDKFIIICIISLVFAMIISFNFKNYYSYKILNIDSKITLKLGDITQFKKSIIISTSSSFIISSDENIISKSSVQGAFQKRFYKKNIETLEKLVNAKLTNDSEIQSMKINEKKYKIGTIIKIDNKKRNIYFVAVTDVNSTRRPEKISKKDLIKALNKLWDYMSNHGNMSELAIPLIGSGNIASTEITRLEALKCIVDTYLNKTKKRIISPELTIYIYPPDLKFVNFEELREYIEAKTKYI